MNNLQIRPASKKEFSIAVGWAAKEGWNPGLNDLDVFHMADPAGFLMGWKGDQPVASISVVNYSSTYGFLGFYIVHPDHRGTGAGMAIWNAGIKHLGNRTIGLDGVIDQQENYKKSGFVYAGRNIRFSGVPEFTRERESQSTIRSITPSDITDLLNYDHAFFHARRDVFIRPWINPEMSAERQTLIAINNNQLIGYGTIRNCRAGHKIGPLFADTPQVAQDLFDKLCRNIPKDSEVSLDVPEANIIACSMAKNHALQPVFETARMYRGAVGPLPIAKIFGITTFELG